MSKINDDDVEIMTTEAWRTEPHSHKFLINTFDLQLQAQDCQ